MSETAEKITANLKCAKKNELDCNAVDLYSVKFIYEDSGEPIKNKWVLYWMFSADGKNILPEIKDIIKAPYDTTTKRNIAIGYTDANGYLQQEGPRPTLTAQIYYEKNTKRNLDSYLNFDSKVFRRTNFGIGGKYKENYPIRTKFPSGRKVAFMLMPAGNKNITYIRTLPFGDLEKSPCVWKGSIDSNDQVVKLRKSLSEWDGTIQQLSDELESAIQNYREVVSPYVNDIVHLDLMEGYVKNMYKFPNKPSERDGIDKIKNIVNDLDAIKKEIADKYVNSTDANKDSGKELEKIDVIAKKLWEALNNPLFIEELERYISYYGTVEAASESKNGGYYIKGPDCQYEIDWTRINYTLEKAYGLLAETNGYGEKAFNEHCKPLFDFFETMGEDSEAANQIFKDLEQISNNSQASPNEAVSRALESKSPVATNVIHALAFVPKLAANSPGPPSLGVGLINVFGMGFTKGMNFKTHAQHASQKMNILLGLMRMFNFGEKIPVEIRNRLERAIRNGDLEVGRKALIDFCAGGISNKYANISGKLFKAGMFLLSIAVFASHFYDNAELTLKKWLSIVESGSGTLLSAGGLFKRFIADSVLKPSIKGLSIIAAIAGTAICTIDAVRAFNENDELAGYLNIAGALGTMLALAGFLVVAGGATIYTGWGVIAMAAGAVLAVVSAIWLFFANLFKEGTEQVFESLRRRYTDSVNYRAHYKDNSIIYKSVDRLSKQENDMEFWGLSWRAVVPLYEAGFVVMIGEKYKLVDIKQTAELIEIMTEIDEEEVLKILEEYKTDTAKLEHHARMAKKVKGAWEEISEESKQTLYEHGNKMQERTDALYESRKKVEDWRDGTIFPNKRPVPIDVGF